VTRKAGRSFAGNGSVAAVRADKVRHGVCETNTLEPTSGY
jgi:hypothetical protein